jgi:hypothetical protein
MVKFTLSDSDKELILKNHVLPVAGVTDQDVESVLWFLENFRYQHGYKRGLYFERPINWTKGYIQALDKVACFFKYGDPLINEMSTG